MISFINFIKNTVLLFVLVFISCGSKTSTNNEEKKITKVKDTIIVGANQTKIYLPLLKGKKVGIVANQTSVIFKTKDSVYLVDPEAQVVKFEKTVSRHTHLVDSLLKLGVNIKRVFAPEHGFRGTADAGEIVKDGLDIKTGLPLISLYGSNKKPLPDQLKDIDIMIFDIQDIGARFYTYISTLHYVMEACAEQGIPIVLLDRPNPNGHYVDGPILEPEHTSFVGMHPVPVVHGMTIGEYAKMINGEKWLKNGISCTLKVIPVKNYTHNLQYSLPIKPSPNLPNDQAINLYPSLCLFEGTDISVGRGTSMQFQVVGSPNLNELSQFDFKFTPRPNEAAKHPKHENKICYGYDLRFTEPLKNLDFYYLITFYNAYRKHMPDAPFFNSFFTKLAGTKKLQAQIESGMSFEQIQLSWTKGLKEFKANRSKYLIYP